ncbi:hypothetical protein DMN91_012930 [Ooceraea biroi]|uniref:YLP motif-containing protein 1 n=1 Tax=Ooceraea biroi TaxID=2015173 RepID=A0A3L8D4V0_OOCBI|nr:hypothetical protein DMN91_012930 [Ooceraea biroi]
MQNWNQWQLSAGAVTTSVPQPPVNYTAAPGADPMALMQSYMQYYNQPTPSGYTQEQWAAAQQQGWSQWQQWQQQYQQWQAQYGDKYQETMKQLSTQNMNFTGQAQLPPNVQLPPLPKEDARPPLPPATTNTYQFAMPPPHQNNLPLFPAKESASNVVPQPNATNHPVNPPLPTSQPPLPSEIGENRENISAEKCDNNVISESSGDKKLKPEEDELTEAERTFDEQFKQWEEQFNKWKQQNANHPDKTQYKQYEAKWTSWREKLLERREQMRKKREQQKQAAAKVVAEKNKNISGNDKILNILSNTENQGLINNLLGIGKTLGLTGKQNAAAPLPPPPPPPPPPPENTNSSNQPTTQVPQQNLMQANMTTPNVALPWQNQQQWGNQHYNPRMEVPGYGPGMPSMPVAPMVGVSPNFTQPPPNLPHNITPNFSQPPPNFSNGNRPPLQNVRAPGPANIKDQPSFGSTDPSNTDARFMPNDRSIHNFGGQSNFRRDDQERRDTSTNPNLNEQDQFKPTDTFGARGDVFNDRAGAQRFRKDDRNYNDFGNNQLNPQSNFNLGNDRFGSANSSFGSGNTRFGEDNNRMGSMGNNKFPLGNDRFGPNNDRFGSDPSRFGNEWIGPESDRFKSEVGPLGIDKNRRETGNDRFDSKDERFGPAMGIDRFEPKDRFFPGNDRFGPNSEHFRPNDRFGRNNANFFESKDLPDHRRDNFGANPRSFNRNPPFSPSNELPPELKKLMEKRKAAGDVFRPSFVDSDKSSTIGSLSESFKKIAGDSPFRSSFDFQKNLPNRSGLMAFSSGPSNFHPHSSSDSGQIPSPMYGSRGHSFNIESPFKGPVDNFAKRNNPIGNERQGKDMEIKVSSDANQPQPTNIQSQVPIKHSESIETANSDPPLQTDDNANNAKVMQTNEADNSIMQMDLVAEGNSKNDNCEGELIKSVEEDKASGNDSLQQDDKTESDAEEKNNDSDNKKSESLPFMGENDPRPEDLNIEPPPELPNLGPISTDLSQSVPLDLNESQKESTDDRCNVRFDRSFDSRGMEFKPDPPFGSQGPPMIGDNLASSRTMMGPASGAFQQGPMGVRSGSPDPNAPNEFNSKRSNDEQYNRDRKESAEGFNKQFNPRDLADERFGQAGPRPQGGGKFGPSDRQLGPRGPIDSAFAPRNPGPFGLPFRPGGVNDCTDFRTIPERPFGPRGPNDASYGLRRPSDATFDTRRVADVPFGPLGPSRFGRPNEAFDKRPLFDSGGPFNFPGERPLAPRRSNEGTPSSLGSSDVPPSMFGPKDALQSKAKSFNDNRFESRDSNDGLCGPSDFKAQGPVGNISASKLSTDRTDPFYDRDDFVRRNAFVRRGQFEDAVPAKKAKYEERSNPDEFNKSYSGRNVDVEVQDNASEYARRMPVCDAYKKTLDDVGHGSRYGFNDTWKDKFGNDQRLDGDQHKAIDKNVPNTFDERSTGSEPKYGSNLFTKQPKPRIGEEFYVQKQFNYNHGEIDKKYTAEGFAPTKVIDYGHASRSSNVERQLSSLCFDYGHGEFKPTMDDQQQQQHNHPKRDFRNWVESEQNLKEYTEKMRNYENMKGSTDKARSYENYYDARKSDYNMRKEHDWQSKDKKAEGERKENEGHKEKGFKPEDRFFECDFSNDQKNRQSDRNLLKERTQEICDNSRKETNKDNDKDNRSKGSISWQESSNKNVIDTKLQDTTSLSSDTKKNVESTAKTLELAKLPNYTMVDDLLCPPGRQNRPPKIAVILRGPPGSGKSFVAKLIKDKEVEQGGSAPRILSLDDYFLVEKEVETKDDNGKKITVKEMVYEYEEAMEQSYITSLVKAFKKNITDGFFNFIILDCINEKITDYEEMWNFAKSKGFKVYICEMEMDLQICLKRNIHNRTEDEINRIIDYFEPTPSYHQKLDVNSMLQEQAIEEVDMEDSQEIQEQSATQNEDSEDSHEDTQDAIGVSKWEKMEAEDKLDRLDGLAKKKSETKPQTMEDFLQVPDYYNMEDTSGKKRVCWADLEERKEQEKMRAVGFVVGHTNWDRMMDPTKGGSALTRTKFFSLS